MAVTVRTVEKVVHETGVGQSNRTETEYQLGAEVEGVFVPFATVSAARVDHYKQLAERDKAAKSAEGK